MKKLVSICLIGALMASLAGCAKTDKKQDEYILQIGTVLNEADPLYVALTEVFEKQVEEKTNGAIDVQIYSGGQLGTDEDVLEQALVGSGVGVITEAGRLSNYVYDFGVLLAPYVASDYEKHRNYLRRIHTMNFVINWKTKVFIFFHSIIIRVNVNYLQGNLLQNRQICQDSVSGLQEHRL